MGETNNTQVATVVAVCTSDKKGVRKKPVDVIELAVGTGVVGDAHAGAWHRQVSLLPDESVDELREVLPTLPPATLPRTSSHAGSTSRAYPWARSSRRARPWSR